MSQRQKNKVAKAERASFFLARTTTSTLPDGHSPIKDGGDPRFEAESASSPSPLELGPDNGPLTTASMKGKMVEFTENIQQTMAAQIHTLTALTPEIHPDQLLIDRAHRLRRPKHIPDTAVRDVIVRVHFFHVKKKLIRASRSPGLPEPYQDLKIFADLSAATLRFRKSMTPLTSTLHTKGIMYQWGYPAKLLIHYRDALHGVNSLETGKVKFQAWGLAIADAAEGNSAKIPRMAPEWTPA
ncbi:Hypothetical predicted protein [Pelobates cultripes]|uniref:Uncharacterized protein n=1 Tax=Pelobates cultripes TaxID=61616 RepID=A0AAD1REU1_PELCU|nr:Hypothetical predicted protein [Pelobates cultripes]